MSRWLPVVLLLGVASLSAALAWAAPATEKPTNGETTLPRGVPAKVARVLKHIDETGRAPNGHVGGRAFGNFEKRLPKNDKSGHPVRYQEWDVNPKIRGKNRGAERLITGSDGSAYYTRDHYRTFTKIR